MSTVKDARRMTVFARQQGYELVRRPGIGAGARMWRREIENGVVLLIYMRVPESEYPWQLAVASGLHFYSSSFKDYASVRTALPKLPAVAVAMRLRGFMSGKDVSAMLSGIQDAHLS